MTGAEYAPDVAGEVVRVLGPDEGAAFLARLDVVRHDLVEALSAVYCGDRWPELLEPPDARGARRRDRTREIDREWFLRARQVGYACYVDRFAGDLTGVLGRLDYLEELGVTYLHLMPLLEPRPGQNDGGYAVADYRRSTRGSGRWPTSSGSRRRCTSAA